MKKKTIVTTYTMLLNLCAYYETKTILFSLDYGYQTMYATAKAYKDGTIITLKTKNAKNKFCKEFAAKAKAKGYNVHLPIVPQYTDTKERIKKVIQNW